MKSVKKVIFLKMHFIGTKIVSDPDGKRIGSFSKSIEFHMKQFIALFVSEEKGQPNLGVSSHVEVFSIVIEL